MSHSQDPRRLAAQIRDLTKRVAKLEGERDKAVDAAERLVFMLHIYGGYTVNSRGPAGCIMDALRAIAPDIADDVAKNGADAVYDVRWAER